MSAFPVDLLLKIKESEEVAVIRQNKIRSASIRIEELKHELELCEQEFDIVITNLKSAKEELQIKKIDLMQADICLEGMNKESQSIDDKISETKTAFGDKFQELTDIVDGIRSDTKTFTNSFGLMANKEVEEQRRSNIKRQLHQELLDLERLYITLNQITEACDKKVKTHSEVERMKEELMASKWLRSELEGQAKELMEKVRIQNLRVNDAKSGSSTALQYKKLQEELSNLRQEKGLSIKEETSWGLTSDTESIALSHNTGITVTAQEIDSINIKREEDSMSSFKVTDNGMEEKDELELIEEFCRNVPENNLPTEPSQQPALKTIQKRFTFK